MKHTRRFLMPVGGWDPGAMEEWMEYQAARGWTPVPAVCVTLFSLFHWPCSTTCLTIRKETGSWRWTALAAAIPTALGFALCALTAGVGRLLGL